MIVAPDPADALAIAAGVIGALDATPDGPSELQYELLEAIARRVIGLEIDARQIVPLSPKQLAAAVTDPGVRHQAVMLMVLMELVMHPLPPELERRVEEYADALNVDDPSLRTTRELADQQTAVMYADVMRNGWYAEETKRLILHGHLGEVMRSKLAYTGLAADKRIATKWQSLADHPADTWGRAVYDFYREHHFPLPGEKHGIYEVGAHHDWIHVLCDYPPTPEGEIDVFAFIAGTMKDPRGFVLFIVTLALFQNASITKVAGRKVKIARADTLGDVGATDRFADALARAAQCNTDVMHGIDHFALAAVPLAEVRQRFNVVPSATPPPPAPWA
jgi:hypothetical protein